MAGPLGHARNMQEVGFVYGVYGPGFFCFKGEFFHEFVTVSDVPAAKALAALEEKGILGGFPLDEHRILWCCTEVNTKEEMDAVVQILKEVQ